MHILTRLIGTFFFVDEKRTVNEIKAKELVTEMNYWRRNVKSFGKEAK